MYGAVTRNAEELDMPEFDLAFYEVKDVTGRAAAPEPSAVNMISCFGDNAAASESSELVPVNDAGEPATRDRDYFDWSYICPTHEEYREGLLEMIDDCVAENEAVRLDDVGFPREGFCRCDRCRELFAESDHDDWSDWRAELITDFVAAATDRIPGHVYLTLYPDPYPGHLYERAGLDVDALADHVDEFVVPLYDLDYGTTYWLETIARGFRTRLGGEYSLDGADPDTPFSIELYAVDVDVDDLVHATEVAETYAENVFFGYDASNASAAIRRKSADEQRGEVHRPE